ncbi:MAG: TetR/AcrR family transcriptional regulator [Sphingomonas sp.]
MKAGRGEAPAPAAAAAAGDSTPDGVVSHNLQGQRLGRKGRATRDRILAATVELLATPQDVPISLSAVARKASLGMTSLYLYFNDLTELLLAVLEPVMATAEETYLSVIRQYWTDEELGARTLQFVVGYHDFWVEHARLLHLRNSMADQQDARMLFHRVGSAQAVMLLLADQISPNGVSPGSHVQSMVTAMMTGLERVMTVSTDPTLRGLSGGKVSTREHLLEAQARLLELGIRDYRARVKGRRF